MYVKIFQIVNINLIKNKCDIGFLCQELVELKVNVFYI